MAEANSTQLKSCEHCCAPFTSIIPKARYCSDKCQRAHYRKTKQYGPFVCSHCHSEFYRRDSRRDKFCGRACSFANRKAQAIELHNSSVVVRAETVALNRIARSVALRMAKCRCCKKAFIKRRKYQRSCGDDCLAALRAAARISKRTSPVARAAKSRRKALARGCNGADRIDPIKVFERDKWRCHLCGIKTPRALRGTLDDKAPELEHIVSLAAGGAHTWGNVACSCRKCNQSKGSASFGQLGLGFAA